MAQRFRKHLHAGRVSMKYSRRSKRGGRRTEEIKCSDTSMVRNKQDFMKILGLQMKEEDKENTHQEEDDVMAEKKNDDSTRAIRIRDCSVVIIGENCKICGLLLKCTSDVMFHTEMRHGNGFIVCGNYIEANILNATEKPNVDIHKRRRSTNTNNDNKLRLKIKIGEEVISEISINRRHLKTCSPTGKTETDHCGGRNKESIALKNDYKSSVVGIDSFASTKNHCDDYVRSVQPLNRTHQRATRDTLLFEGSQHNGNGNYVEATRDMEELNSPIESLQERLPWRSLGTDVVRCNNNNDGDDDDDDNNNNNNNKSSNIKDSLISECNMSDKENESRKTQPVKKVMDVSASMQGVKTNLPSYRMDSDNEEIQEILHTIERKQMRNCANIKRRFNEDYSYGKLSQSEEFVESAKKIHRPTYPFIMSSMYSVIDKL